MLIPLIFLSIGAISSGYIFKGFLLVTIVVGFGKGSIFFLNEIKYDVIPLWFLLITPILVIISIPMSFYLYILNSKVLEDFKNTNLPLYNFLLNKWYIDELYEKVFVNPAKKIGSFFFGKKGDIGIIDKFGPDGISRFVKFISSKTSRLQTGFIFDYAFVMLLGLSILLTYLILK